VNQRDLVRRSLPDLAILLSGFLIAKWWGLLFGIACVVIARFGTKALVANALCVLAAMVIAVLFETSLRTGFTYVKDRPVANELGLLLVVAVIALVVPRPHSGR
jgi:uncharacterized membrane protein YwaF